MESDNIAIINDQHTFSGISAHIYKIYRNLKQHKIPTEFHQFLISDSKPELSDAFLRYGYLHSIGDHSKYVYSAKLALNYLTGTNWRSFKGVNSDIMLLSGPTLLPLTKYNHNSIVIGHDLYFLDHLDGSRVLARYMKKKYEHFKDARFILVDSYFTKNEFIEKLELEESKIQVVYPYVDLELFHPGTANIRNILKISEKDVLLLSVGGDNPNKNIETVLRLMRLLPYNFKLVRVGRNFNTLGMISDLNLNGRVIVLDNIDIGLLTKLYKGSDVLLFPSLYEGFGIPLIEAMASGLPFITSDRGSLPEVAGDSGIICNPFDLESMVSSLMQLVQDESYKKKIIKKGLERVKDFSAEKQFQSLQGVINQVSF